MKMMIKHKKGELATILPISKNNREVMMIILNRFVKESVEKSKDAEYIHSITLTK